jgi:hypothetical protein
VRQSRHTAAQRIALAAGAALSLPGLIAYTLWLNQRGGTDALRSILYNGPTGFVFLVLLAELIVLARYCTTSALIRSHGATLVVWAIAATLLALRLGPMGIEVSGHMTWAPVLVADAWIRGFPAWFVALAIVGGVSAIYLKLEVFGGPSGVPGLVAGGVLAGILVWYRATQRSRRNAS